MSTLVLLRTVSLLAMGEALAFDGWPAFFIVLFGIVPTVAWRVRAEDEKDQGRASPGTNENASPLRFTRP